MVGLTVARFPAPDVRVRQRRKKSTGRRLTGAGAGSGGSDLRPPIPELKFLLVSERADDIELIIFD